MNKEDTRIIIENKFGRWVILITNDAVEMYQGHQKNMDWLRIVRKVEIEKLCDFADHYKEQIIEGNHEWDILISRLVYAVLYEDARDAKMKDIIQAIDKDIKEKKNESTKD